MSTEPVDYLTRPSVHLPAGLLAVLQLKAEGHTAWEIAHHLGLSHDEVRVRLATLYRTLWARNAPNAVLVGCRFGLIDLDRIVPKRGGDE